jgi:hypothetical protein
VWFTQAGTGGTGNPIKVTGVTSNGNAITVAIPATAGKGDVLVRNNGTGNSNLSDQWPIDPGSGPSCGVASTARPRSARPLPRCHQLGRHAELLRAETSS